MTSLLKSDRAPFFVYFLIDRIPPIIQSLFISKVRRRQELAVAFPTILKLKAYPFWHRIQKDEGLLT